MDVLSEPVLVLNRHWQPIGTTTVRDALGTLCSPHKENPDEPKAKVICPDTYASFSWKDWSHLQVTADDRTIASANLVSKVPNIIMHLEYGKVPSPKSHFSRRTLFKRDKNTCQYCLKKGPLEEMNIDHVVPRAQGGVTTWENCVVSCLKCNAHKANRTPEQAGMKLHCVPAKPKAVYFKHYSMKHIKTWKNFVSEAYWNVELENDNA